MARKTAVIGRVGHMDENGGYVEETVTVLVEDGEYVCIGNDTSEKAAERRAQGRIDEAKEEHRKQQEARERAQRGDEG